MKSVRIKIELNYSLGNGEAFGVRRSRATFPVLQLTNDLNCIQLYFFELKSWESGARSPHSKGFAGFKWLIQFKLNLHRLRLHHNEKFFVAELNNRRA